MAIRFFRRMRRPLTRGISSQSRGSCHTPFSIHQAGLAACNRCSTMRTAIARALAILSTFVRPPAQSTDHAYLRGPDSEPHAGVPQGKVLGPNALPSSVYPNTNRNYWMFTPAQYDLPTPAYLMVFFDGHAFVGLKRSERIPHVFDNLIYRREMPVTIGVFINPGRAPRSGGRHRCRLGRSDKQSARRI